MIHVIAVITAKPGKRDAILQAFRANVPAAHTSSSWPWRAARRRL